MDLLRHQLETHSSGVFQQEVDDNDNCKVNTEIFDNTLPSELEFDDPTSPQSQSQNLKEQESTVLQNILAHSEHSQPLESEPKPKTTTPQPSDYEMLTKSIVNFTFKKTSASLIIRQTEHPIGSYIPFELKIKTFEVKFYDEQSELSKGIPTYKLLWKSVVGYVKTELYIKNGFVYLLERKKEGFYVHSIWDLQHLFKLFSDREEHLVRLIFRTLDNNETKLVTKQIKSQDLNLLAHLFEQAQQLQITCDN